MAIETLPGAEDGPMPDFCQMPGGHMPPENAKQKASPRKRASER
jgi:hypothetical protein